MIQNPYILSRLTPSIEQKFKLAIIDSPAVAEEMRHEALCHTHEFTLCLFCLKKVMRQK